MKLRTTLTFFLIILFTTHLRAQVFLSEGFESGQKPEGWEHEYVTGNEPWRFRNGGHNPLDANWDDPPDEEDIARNPPSAFEGSYNAIFFKQSSNFETTKLITPELNVQGSSSLQLSFYLCQITWDFGGSPGTDELRIYYKTTAEGEWILLREFTDPVWDWELQQISLPNPSETYYVAFEGRTRWGFGTCIDNVLIEETGSTPMYIGEFDVQQPFRHYVPSGQNNTPMIRLDFNVFGNTDSIQLNQIRISSANTDDTDISSEGVKLYYTETQVFETDQILGTPSHFNAGVANFTGLGKTLPAGRSYVWVTYDVDQNATNGNLMDVKVQANDIVTSKGSYPSITEDPFGYREIFAALYSEDFEGAQEWTLTGEFEVATPDGAGEGSGNPNPPSAYEGSGSLGTDLTGLGANPYNYEPLLSENGADLATSPGIEALYYKNLNLFYQRQINIEWADSAHIQVSNDNGASWNTFWTKSANQMAEYQWTQQKISIPDHYARSNQLQIRFKLGPTNGYGNYSGWHIDDLFLTGEFISKDVGVSEWVAPLSGTGHTENEEVTVRITNYGGADIVDPVPIAYSFDGGHSWTINQMNEVIPVGGSALFSFASGADLSEPGFRPSVLAKTVLPGDQYTGNDQLATEIYIVPTYTPPYTENLEPNDGYWRPGGPALWQHGDPEKQTIQSAASGSNCWVSSLTAMYGHVLSLPGEVIFEDDFEIEGAWTFTGEFEREIPSWDYPPYNAHAYSLYCIGTDLSGDPGGAHPYLYENGINDASAHTATSPPMDVRQYGDLKVSFYSWTEMNAGDSIKLEASADDGASWHTLWKNSEGEIIDWDFNYHEYDIPEALSNSDGLLVRFSLFHTSPSGPVAAGWNIDNFQLTGDFVEEEAATLCSPAFDLSGMEKPVITAKLWIDTEEGVDGATLEYSLDDGESWTGITNSSGYDTYWNWYTGKPVTALGTNGWSGQSADWINVSHMLPAAVLNQSNVQFRMKFKADKSNNLFDGVALDDIRIMEAPQNLDLISIMAPASSCELSANQNFTLRMKNTGPSTLQEGDTIRIGYQIDRAGDIQTAEEDYALTADWTAGATRDLNLLAPFDFSQSGTYHIQAYYMTEDPHFYSPVSGDTLEQVIQVRKPAVDLGDDISTFRADTVLLKAYSGEPGQNYLWQDGSTDSTFQVASEGTYYVRVSNSLGCVASDTVQVLQLVKDLGVVTYLGQPSACELEGLQSLTVMVENLGTDTLEIGQSFFLGGVINNGESFGETMVIDQRLTPGSSIEHQFAQTFDLSNPNEYRMKFFTDLDDDADFGNDTLFQTIEVWGYPDANLGPDTVVASSIYLLAPGQGYPQYLWQDESAGESFLVKQPGLDRYHVTISDENGCISSDTVLVTLEVMDLAIDRLLSPSTSCELSTSVTVSAQLKNAGNIIIASGTAFQMNYSINEGPLVQESVSLSEDLLPGHKLEYSFSSSESVETGLWYDFEVFVDYDSDVVQGNDTILASVGIFETPSMDLGPPYQVVAGFEHTLDAGEGFQTYLWQDGSAAQTFTVSTPGVARYSVTVTDENGCEAYDEVDLMLTVPDVGILEIIHPVTACRMTENEQLQVAVKNFGNWEIPAGEEITVAYSINGAMEVREVITLTEAFKNGAVMYHTFNQAEDLSIPGSFEIMSYTSYEPDLITSNDLILVSLDHRGSPDIMINDGADSILAYEPFILEVESGYPAYSWQDGSTGTSFTVAGPSAGWYTVSVAAENGCVTTDSVYAIYDVPDLELVRIVSPASGCDLGTRHMVSLEIRNNGYRSISPEDSLLISYSVDGASSVIELALQDEILPWGSSRILSFDEAFDLSAKGSYQLHTSLIYEEDLSAANNILEATVQHWMPPVVEINQGEDTIIGNLPLSLDAGSGFSEYLWSDQSSSSIIQADQYGLYWVMVTDEHACTGRDSIRLISLTSSGLLPGTENGLHIYPNPADELLRIQLEQVPHNGLFLELYSSSNVLMLQEKVDQLSAGEVLLNVQSLIPGTYMLRIRADEHVYHRLVVVE